MRQDATLDVRLSHQCTTKKNIPMKCIDDYGKCSTQLHEIRCGAPGDVCNMFPVSLFRLPKLRHLDYVLSDLGSWKYMPSVSSGL